MNLLIFLALVTLALADPGLLRVPKVYNAVITSNQNLSPSRAYPVIQPVIHRTAVGYVPPIYYTQVAPHLAGSDVPYLAQGAQKPNQPETQASATTIEQSRPTDVENAKDVKVAANADPKDIDPKDIDPKPKAREQEPFSFYPNYQSLYYDPYFYTYNGFNPHLVPGTFYADYQPYGTLEPIPASTPKNGLSEHLLPAYHEEKKLTTNERKEKIPDVPPPPLPTAMPKNS